MGYPNATRVNGLLSQICTERGWCKPPGTDDLVRAAAADGATEAIADGSQIGSPDDAPLPTRIEEPVLDAFPVSHRRVGPVRSPPAR